MYLNTIGLKEWSVRIWYLHSINGLTENNSVVLSKRSSIKNYHEEDTVFLKNFLKALNTLPSHYCSKDTDRLYLEQQFQSFAELHREYSKKCIENNRMPQSITSLQKIANDIKLSLFRPRKDLCDLCFKYRNNNMSEEDYQAHIRKKDSAREEKQRDKDRTVNGTANVITIFSCKFVVL
ncbi:unnamed protein product [Psylliodes chrysocephalus]|uniref:Uncharacterized protein n=1 Tax=Psylliodes chrysocephalus TaxID=3402493 RepID=A0A9P0GIH6_9CUCU|nr:unnamed protein product [Psylliodes chrysocephala]